jgi:hypothetical protein
MTSPSRRAESFPRSLPGATACCRSKTPYQKTGTAVDLQNPVLGNVDDGGIVAVDLADPVEQGANHAAMGDADGRTFDRRQEFVCPLGQHGVTFRPLAGWPEKPLAPVALFDQVGRMHLDLAKRLPFPVTERQFDQKRIGAIGEGIEAGCLAHQLHCLARPSERACHPVELIEWKLERGELCKGVAIVCRLSATLVVKRDVPRTLQPLLPIVVRLAMADYVEKHASFLVGDC